MLTFSVMLVAWQLLWCTNDASKSINCASVAWKGLSRT